jgi:hypothetical protein
VVVKRGHEIDLEYSKKEIIDKMNSFFGYMVVENLKFITSNDAHTKFNKEEKNNNDVTNNKYTDRIKEIKNDKVKKSLLELTKVFKQR